MAWDSPLGPLGDLVAVCAAAAEPVAGSVTVTRLVVQMPVELQSYALPSGDVSLGVAPPRQALETSVMPVLHRIRIVVVVEP
jgi:hypothetical protein